MADVMNFESFAPKFGPWADIFRPFIESKEMYEIYQKLKSEKEPIVPKSEYTFDAFRHCMPHNLKVVWYLIDPYAKRYRNGADQATGIAMDCRNTPDGTLQPSLVKFYEAIEDSEKTSVIKTPDLTYLCNQGVLLLNTDLTCKLNKTGSHRGLWEPFQKFFIDHVQKTPGMIFVLSGEVSLSMEKYINPLVSKIIKTEHPAAAARAERAWQYNNIFKSINILLHEKQEKIFWNKKDWDSEPPF